MYTCTILCHVWCGSVVVVPYLDRWVFRGPPISENGRLVGSSKPPPPIPYPLPLLSAVSSLFLFLLISLSLSLYVHVREDPLPYRPQDEFRAYSAQPPSPSSSPSPTRNRSRTSASITTKTRFPSLAPTPGSFLVSGDTRAAGAVAHARKTWAPPALRTQAVTSYGAVPDLEVTAPRACCVCWLVS